MTKEKTRSYTNSDGMTIEVSKEHLDRAVDIKLELQESTYGRRCNWNTHKQMMEQDGFVDSDTNEAYRCLIKGYQNEIGKLAKVDSYADYVADGKLESLKQVVGEVYYAKKDASQVFRKLNKVKDEISKVGLVVETIRDFFIDEFNFSIPHYAYQPKLASSKNKGIAIITDWHLGATVNGVKGNYFNLEIAKKRIDKYKQEILDYCKLFNITELTVGHLGDAIEHISMRNVNQAFEAELNFAQQIVKASELIIHLLVQLSEHINVEFFSLAGNHDRSNGNKDSNIDGDNAMIVINESVNNFIRMSKISRLSIIEQDTDFNYEMVREFNGSKIKFVHGDNESRGDSNRIAKHEAMDEVTYKAVISAHFHSFHVTERNYGKLEIQFGSLMGRNNYSRKMKAVSDASQGLVIVREDGEIIPIRIGLQIV